MRVSMSGSRWLFLAALMILSQALASDAKPGIWFYQTYYNYRPMNAGYVTLEDEGGKAVFKMLVPGVSRCYRDALEATVARTETTTIVTIVSASAGCDETRFVIKNDGTGGRRETRKGSDWVWDGADHGLTRLVRTSDATLSADIAAAAKKLSDDQLAAPGRAISLPGNDVPASCASLVGGWTGHWGNHGGEQWIWIVQVDSNCIAKYQIGRTGYRGPFEVAEIRNGVLTNAGAQGGTINWKRHGDELWASYSGPSGSTGAVHKKIQIEAK